MFGPSPLVIGIVVAVATLAASFWWYGIHRRRQAEMTAGIAALANMKWRECIGLVLQALAREGYAEEHSTRKLVGDGGTEFLLRKDGKQTLLSYKHGTAYRLGEANVRDFANAVQLQGAANGILVTLGTSEAFARDIARRYEVQLIDGVALWRRIQPYLPPELLKHVRAHAAGHTRHALDLGVVASLVLGALAYFGAGMLQPKPEPVAPPVAAVVAAPAPSPATSTASATAPAAPDSTASRSAAERNVADVTAAVQAMEEIAALDDAQRTERRQRAAASVSEIGKVRAAMWSTQSTLVLALIESDGADQQIIDEACRILVQFEELRYSRLQLEPPPDSGGRVRWRQCQ